MISPHKTTSLVGPRVLRALRRGAWGAAVGLLALRAAPAPAPAAPPAAPPAPAAPLPPLSPAPLLRLLSGDVPTELTADHVEWDEPRGALTARGVLLAQRGADGAPLTLRCPHAALRLAAPRPGAPLALTAAVLGGGVRVEGAEGALSASEARWEEGAPLTLTLPRGEWRGQRVEAARAELDLRARALRLSGVRATLRLPALDPRGDARPPRR
ncbi:MAG: hypothetical protein FJ138_07580 [Deltaproteobacteria bacterium]|nr:hypothetical protein [Deltaproteobacteria bacterium]